MSIYDVLVTAIKGEPDKVRSALRANYGQLDRTDVEACWSGLRMASQLSLMGEEDLLQQWRSELASCESSGGFDMRVWVGLEFEAIRNALATIVVEEEAVADLASEMQVLCCIEHTNHEFCRSIPGLADDWRIANRLMRSLHSQKFELVDRVLDNFASILGLPEVAQIRNQWSADVSMGWGMLTDNRLSGQLQQAMDDFGRSLPFEVGDGPFGAEHGSEVRLAAAAPLPGEGDEESLLRELQKFVSLSHDRVLKGKCTLKLQRELRDGMQLLLDVQVFDAEDKKSVEVDAVLVGDINATMQDGGRYWVVDLSGLPLVSRMSYLAAMPNIICENGTVIR